ncbi:MAG TPA: thioredoxin domain-containing protein [Pyrinomonadaceae bacterium]|nr:thioredoxin domain-containing protein [Pyrinomonadaceae bacterium]
MASKMAATLSFPVSERDHVQGSPDAAVTLVEYGDYECPHCGRAHAIVKQVQKVAGDHLRFVFRHFPLAQMHPHAERAAEAAEAAGAHGRFWQMHDLLYENQQTLDDTHLLLFAEAIDLDTERFARELRDEIYRERVREDFMSGVRSGVNGTPTFFINDVRHDGPWDIDSLLYAIEQAV